MMSYWVTSRPLGSVPVGSAARRSAMRTDVHVVARRRFKGSPRSVSYILNRVRVGRAEGRGQLDQAWCLVRGGGDRVWRSGSVGRPGSASLRERVTVPAT